MKTEFVDVHDSDFPFTIRYYDPETNDELCDPIHVDGPGAVSICGFGRPTIVEVTWPDGTVSRTE